MKYNIVKLHLKSDVPIGATASKVRGYIGNEFSEHMLLHNHINEDKYIFNYPFIQYKVIDNEVIILGIDEGGEILKKISPEITCLDVDRKYRITEKILSEKEADIKPSSEEKHYKFITP